jgi:CheY-like chemotaxis protein
VDSKERRKAYELRERMNALRQPVVLLAEDDPDLRRLVATTLRLDGYGVVEARDGAELLEHIGSALLFGNLRGELHPVGIVISDIRMPGHSGLEVLAGLRRASVDVAMILMTAYPDPKVREEALRFGADAFLSKPFELDELRAVVHGLAPALSMPESPPSWRASS